MSITTRLIIESLFIRFGTSCVLPAPMVLLTSVLVLEPIACDGIVKIV